MKLKFLGSLSAIFSVIIIFGIGTISAQTAGDALRYSSLQYTGTARTIGVGNAIGALGGDFSALSINPAGIATYRRSELTVSGGYFGSNSNSLLTSGGNNATLSDLNEKATFNNVGLIFASNPSEGGDWKTSNFGIGYNRLADFNRTIYYNGTSAGSLVTVFKNQAELGMFDNLGNILAYDTQALFDTTVNGQKSIYSDFNGKERANIHRSQTVTQTGGVGEGVISYGGNYRDKLSLGATIGIPFVNYTYANTYGEDNAPAQVSTFKSLTYKDNYTTTGTGINLKIGAIYKFTPELRIGVALHSPTFYALSDTRNAYMNYTYTVQGKDYFNESTSADVRTDYTITTPFKTMINGAYLFGKNGFISADAEYVNYAGARLRITAPDSISSLSKDDLKTYEATVNNDIQTKYKSAFNFRLGGELAFNILRLRAGFNLFGSPNLGDNTYRNAYSFGLGLRGDNIFLDLAYRNEDQNFSYQPYNAAEAARYVNVDVKNRISTIVTTVGIKF